MDEIIRLIQNFLYSPEQQYLAYSVVDAIAFFLFSLAVLYLLVFAYKSTSKKRNEYPSTKKRYRFGVIFTSLRSDKQILESIDKFLEQKYPRDKYDIIVVGVGLKLETITMLQSTSAVVIVSENDKDTKSISIQRAMDYIERENLAFDIVLIFNADNIVEADYLEKLNNAFYSGCSAVQTHCMARNNNTSIAVLDAVSEEINNSIFRKGHTSFGFSSGLSGTGMAFEYDILKKYFANNDVQNMDKQLERFLLKNEYYIEYLSDVCTYTEKVSQTNQFYKQRQHWISTQIYNFFKGIWGCPKAAFEGNWDYCNKLLQWAMPPRILLLGFIILIAIGFTIVGSMWAIKWWVLLMILILVLAFAIPDYLFNGKLLKALFSLPIIFVMMLANAIIGVFKRTSEE